MKNIRITNNVCIIITDSKVNTLSNGLNAHIKKHNLTFDKVIQTTPNSLIFLENSKDIYGVK